MLTKEMFLKLKPGGRYAIQFFDQKNVIHTGIFELLDFGFSTYLMLTDLDGKFIPAGERMDLDFHQIIDLVPESEYVTLQVADQIIYGGDDAPTDV